MEIALENPSSIYYIDFNGFREVITKPYNGDLKFGTEEKKGWASLESKSSLKSFRSPK